MAPRIRLAFEKEIYEVEEVLAKLEAGGNGQLGGLGGADEIRRMRRDLVRLMRKIYSNLTPWQTVEVARHPERPQTLDYIDLIFEEFVEMHRDRAFGED